MKTTCIALVLSLCKMPLYAQTRCVVVSVAYPRITQEMRGRLMHKEAVGIESDTIAVVTIQNTTDHPVTRIERADGTIGDAEGGVSLMIVDKAGEPVKESELGMQIHHQTTQTDNAPFEKGSESGSAGTRHGHVGSMFSIPVTMRPGESYQVLRNLDREYVLDRNRSYVIKATVKDPCSQQVVESHLTYFQKDSAKAH